MMLRVALTNPPGVSRRTTSAAACLAWATSMACAIWRWAATPIAPCRSVTTTVPCALAIAAGASTTISSPKDQAHDEAKTLQQAQNPRARMLAQIAMEAPGHRVNAGPPSLHRKYVL